MNHIRLACACTFWTYQSRHCEISGMHFLGQPVNLSSCVQEDNSLGDCQGLVEVAQCVQLPLLQNEWISISGAKQRREPSFIDILAFYDVCGTKS